MAETKTERPPRAPRTPIYSANLGETGKFEISSYQFTLPEGTRKGEVLDLVEIKTVKKKYSEEQRASFDQVRSVTISMDQFRAFAEFLSKAVPAKA